MPMDRFLIAPFNTGLQTNVRPWLIMDDAFASLQNAYVFRGRVRKRFGSVLMGSGWSSLETAPLFARLAINVGTTNGSGDLSGTVQGFPYSNPGQGFSIGNEIFTVPALGTPVDMLTTGSSTTHTFNTTTGDFVFVGATPATIVYFYPSLPVMGITVYQAGSSASLNNAPSYAFDTKFAYLFANGFWLRSGTGTSPIWHGTDTNFFWATTWRGSSDSIPVMFVTNFFASVPTPIPLTDDPIWYTTDGATWTSITPFFAPGGGAIGTGPFVQTARIILPFKDRLVLLNTIENTNTVGATTAQYVNRARFSHNGNPLDVNAWYQANQFDASGNFADGAGFIDAATEEQIVSAEFIKDRLIVYFERSTWELAWTGNDVLPFQWQKINTELGSESLQSTVPFDKQILTIGQTGVHSCNGANVERIDVLIPQQIFDINDKTSGVERVAGIRDFFVETVYWTFPSSSAAQSLTYPNQVLVYNYQNRSWSLNTDCITAFGYFEQQAGTTWANSEITWAEAGFTWNSGSVQNNFRQVIAGNQQGFMFFILPDIFRNSPSMQISQMTTSGTNISLTVVNHTLLAGEYVAIENAQGVTGVNGNIYKVQTITDANNIIVGPAAFTGVYTGAGTLARVSNYNILSKQYNPYVDKGRNVYISKIDFGVQRTTNGQVTVDYYPSSTELSMLQTGIVNNSILGDGVLETSPYTFVAIEALQDRLWHQIYFQSDGECIQLFISMSDTQIRTPLIAWSNFQLEGMVLHTTPTTDRLQ
jgi:hypothetical protein